MKKFLLLILLPLFLLGCQGGEAGESPAPPEAPVTAGEGAKDKLHQLEKQVFLIEEENLSNAAEESLLEFGQAFVNLFNGAIAEQEEISFAAYISNPNLLAFAQKMLALSQKQFLQGGSGLIYGLDNTFLEHYLQKLEENLYALALSFQFEGSGQHCDLLISTENGSLKLLDFYFGSKDGADTFATGHMAERERNNPHLWEDENWVQGVWEKLAEFEAGLNP